VASAYIFCLTAQCPFMCVKETTGKAWGQLWDRFSWFGLHNPAMMHDIEALLLKMLPLFLRSRNKQGAGFVRSKREDEKNKIAIHITRKVRR
jgi:hypothetical protein